MIHDMLCHGWDRPIIDCPPGDYARPCAGIAPHPAHYYRRAVLELGIDLLWCPGVCNGSCMGAEVLAG